MFSTKKHDTDLYNNLLILSRNIFFYKKISLKDTFETRLYLMFIHFSIILKIFKKKGKKFDQIQYDYFFHNIENNLRESGLGDVSVNKKMKDFNKTLYDILLKIDKETSSNSIIINPSLISKYFDELNNEKDEKYIQFSSYFVNFFNFCFELSLENMIRECIKFKY